VAWAQVERFSHHLRLPFPESPIELGIMSDHINLDDQPDTLCSTFSVLIPTPNSYGMIEHPSAAQVRAQLCAGGDGDNEADEPLSIHILHGLAYTVGSALGCTPPSIETCLAAFVVPNKVGLTAGARAWSKHFHRSQKDREGARRANEEKDESSNGWWGKASGSKAVINEKALGLFWKVMNGASWRNLHWLPHGILVYEVRVLEGYGMRWSQEKSEDVEANDGVREWVFRGFLEPQMENGHEVGWKH